MEKTLRTVQPAHKSEKITVSQASKAWKKVEAGKSLSTGRSKTQSRVLNPAVRDRTSSHTKVAADRSRT